MVQPSTYASFQSCWWLHYRMVTRKVFGWVLDVSMTKRNLPNLIIWNTCRLENRNLIWYEKTIYKEKSMQKKHFWSLLVMHSSNTLARKSRESNNQPNRPSNLEKARECSMLAYCASSWKGRWAVRKLYPFNLSVTYSTSTHVWWPPLSNLPPQKPSPHQQQHPRVRGRAAWPLSLSFLHLPPSQYFSLHEKHHIIFQWLLQWTWILYPSLPQCTPSTSPQTDPDSLIIPV